VDMTLAIPGGLYAPLSGTSFAAPMVSAIAGLIASKYPKAAMAKIKTAIVNSGDLDPALTGKTITGRRVNAFNALQYMAGIKPPAPAPAPDPPPAVPPPPPPAPPPTDIIDKIKDIISKWF
jgi:subtilisin family serine protease